MVSGLCSGFTVSTDWRRSSCQYWKRKQLVFLAFLLVSNILEGFSVGQANAAEACLVSSGIRLQSFIDNSAAPFSIVLCQNLPLGEPIDIAQQGTITGGCPGGPCIVRLGDGVAGPLFKLHDGDVTFTNVTFENGVNKDGNGGAVQVLSSTSSVTFVDSTFSGNSAQNGGAIASLPTPVQGIATFLRSNFLKNTAHTADSTGQGGAVFWTGPLVCGDCTFDGNQADESGGAIHVDGSSSVGIRGSRFLNNFLTSDSLAVGGAIRVTFRSEVLTVASSLFDNNFIRGTGTLNAPSRFKGGAIHATSAFRGVANTFRGNSAGVQGTGGAVQLEGSSNTICGPHILQKNTAQTGQDYGILASAQATVCPALPPNASLSTGTPFPVNCSRCGCSSLLCDPNSVCNAQKPNDTLSCTCKAGYIGDGFFCTPGVMPVTTSPSLIPSSTTQTPTPSPLPPPPPFTPVTQPPTGGGGGGGSVTDQIVSWVLGGGAVSAVVAVVTASVASYKVRSQKGQAALEVAHRLNDRPSFGLPDEYRAANHGITRRTWLAVRDKLVCSGGGVKRWKAGVTNADVLRDLVWDALSVWDILNIYKVGSSDNSSMQHGIWYTTYAGHRCDAIIGVLRDLNAGQQWQGTVVRTWLSGTAARRNDLVYDIQTMIEGRAASFVSNNQRPDSIAERLIDGGCWKIFKKIFWFSNGVSVDNLLRTMNNP